MIRKGAGRQACHVSFLLSSVHRLDGHMHIAIVDLQVVVDPGAAVHLEAGMGPQTDVSSQICISYSEDKGKTWSEPQAIAPPVPDTSVKR